MEYMPRLREAMIDWIVAINANKFITICFDRLLSPEYAESYLNSWFRRLHQKLNRKCPELSGPDYVAMHGSCEYRGDQSIHYHIAAHVPESKLEVFDQKATKAWRSVLPKARIDIRDIGDTQEDAFRVARYMTKSNNYAEFWRPISQPQTVH